MVTIQEVHSYLKLAELGLVTPVTCEKDYTHPELVCSFNDQEEIEFYCLVCSFKIRPGEKRLSEMKQKVIKFSSLQN